MKDKKLLQDILEAIEAIEDYSVATYDDFVANSITQDAIFYNLIIIGEGEIALLRQEAKMGGKAQPGKEG